MSVSSKIIVVSYSNMEIVTTQHYYLAMLEISQIKLRFKKPHNSNISMSKEIKLLYLTIRKNGKLILH